jgi:ferric-dicitrate binding protein FerR (iron transport regulator)
MTAPSNHNTQPAADSADRDEVLRLASALVDGVISVDGQADLERRLLADPAARDAFRGFMRAESILAWELAGGDTSLVQSEPEPVRAGRFAMPKPMTVAAGLLAALMIVALPAWLLRQREPARQVIRVVMPAGEQVATLTDDDHARWEGEPFDGQGNHVASGPLRLAEGSAQVTFLSGAIVAIHSPTEIEILSVDRIFLRSGRITPYVPPSAHGFTVVSPSGEIVDLGTEFTVGVDATGRTDVFVIDGEVDVASGHTRAHHDAPLRMTQGFGSRLVAAEPAPVPTQEPIVIDHFGGGESEPLRWINHDDGYVSEVRDGAVWIPIAAPLGRKEPFVRSVLDHDWSAVAGRRSTISFKVTLPEEGTNESQRWLALVVDDGTGDLPRAFDSSASCAVLISPDWQVGFRVDGEPANQGYVFARGEPAVGPFQVVVTIDDTPQGHALHGGTVCTVMVNGNEIATAQRFNLAPRPRLQLQTFATAHSGTHGFAVVDDFSVSVSTDSVPEPPADR